MVYTLSVKSISHRFGKKSILSDINFECRTGEITGIFGRNGTGKSTLFKTLFGTLKPNQSEIYFDNEIYKPGIDKNSFIGYHTQEIMLPKNIKVAALISLYTPIENQNKVFYSPGVFEMQDKHVGKLSIGQQRYLQFLLLLNLDHSFLILDEPFSMVEPLYKNIIKEMIIEHKSRKGFIITDHYYLDVLEISDQALLIKDGKIYPIETNSDLIKYEYLSSRSILY